EDGYAQVIREQAYSTAEGLELAVGGVLSFGKHQNAVAAVHGLSGIGEALAEAGLSRQGKEVQQRHRERPTNAIVDCVEPHAMVTRRPQRFQRLAAGCSRDFVPDTRGKRGLNESDIDIADVVRDNEQRPADAAQVFAPDDAWTSQKKHNRP